MRQFWVIVAVLILIGCSLVQSSKEQRQLGTQIAKYKVANPFSDLQAAWDKDDFRFIGVYGITLDTPGVARGEDKGFIHLVGIKPIEGTTDALRFPEQVELNNVAFQYAKKYNLLLFKRLQYARHIHPAIIGKFKQIEEELRLLEKSNPKTDLSANLKKKDFLFIYLYDTGLSVASEMDFDALKPDQFQMRKLKGSKDLMTKEQYRRLQRVAVRYVSPYNQMLFKYLRSKNGRI